MFTKLIWPFCLFNKKFLFEMHPLNSDIHEENIACTWSAHISAAVFLWQTFFLLLLPAFFTLSLCPLQAWKRGITACCHWAPFANLKQACFMIDLPFFPSFSAYCHIAPFKWRASQADSLALSSFPLSIWQDEKKEQGVVVGEGEGACLMP